MVNGLFFYKSSSEFRQLCLNYLSLVFCGFVARVVTDRVSGYSKGFGFVRYVSLEDAAEGIKGMDGKVS